MPNTHTIEEQVSALLNDTPATVSVGGETYEVAPPTFARLALISKEIARLDIDPIDPAKLTEGVLREARHSYQLARVLAVAIGKERRPLHKRILDRLTRTTLADRIYRTATPGEAAKAFTEILQSLQIGDFFALTTFLSDVNIMKPTKVDETTEATAPGASLQA